VTPEFAGPAWARAPWHWTLAEWVAKAALRPAQLLLSAPCFLFLGALTAMLLRHPDVQFYEIDRVAFGLLLLGVIGRAIVLRQELNVFERASWPMIGLTVLTLISVAGRPFGQETWSLLASKFIVPFALFHLAALVFTDEKRLRHFEIFSLLVLAYLTWTALAFLFNLRWLVFPHFILDASVGAHADRARGPLLQAVANGVSLNVLFLLALHSYQRSRARGTAMKLLLALVPLAILATMTRSVWLSFAGTVIALLLLSKRDRSWRLFGGLAVIGASVVALAFGSDQLRYALRDRLNENKPVEFRQIVYAGAWDMFLQRPLTGWGFNQMPHELPRHVPHTNEKALYPHNTYLELLAEHGVLGFALYLWLMRELWKLRSAPVPTNEKAGFLNQNFHRLWPIILAVYWLNAAIVVMSYQFVNALIFTMAGMLAAQRRRAQMVFPC
jgi:putative inorganic carbon (HCO3(-)) transporter